MSLKAKHILIGLVIPTIIAIAICVVFYFENAGEEHKEMAEYLTTEDESQEHAKIVKLTKDNWDKYFTLETKVDLSYNEADELVKVCYVNCLSLKEEYHDKISLTQRESTLNITYKQPAERMKYKITDAKAGEWKIGEKLVSDAPRGEHDKRSIAWSRDFTVDNDFVQEEELDGGEYLGQLFLQVPEELEVEAAAGILVLDR